MFVTNEMGVGKVDNGCSERNMSHDRVTKDGCSEKKLPGVQNANIEMFETKLMVFKMDLDIFLKTSTFYL